MIRKNCAGLIAAIAAAAMMLPVAVAQAHDSNTLHKLGKAIQYPVRKDTENLSIDTHRSEHRKSVESMRPQRATAVVTPSGRQYVIAHRGNAYRRYAYRHHYYKNGHYTHYYR
jgi:hypothetical protein